MQVLRNVWRNSIKIVTPITAYLSHSAWVQIPLGLVFFPKVIIAVAERVDKSQEVRLRDVPLWWVLSAVLFILLVLIFGGSSLLNSLPETYPIRNFPIVGAIAEYLSYGDKLLPLWPLKQGRPVQFLSVWVILGLLLYAVSFCILAFKQAKRAEENTLRVEQKIRRSIKYYDEFVEFVIKALKHEVQAIDAGTKASSEIITVLWMPYFKVTTDLVAGEKGNLGQVFDLLMPRFEKDGAFKFTLVTAENPITYCYNTFKDAATQGRVVLKKGDTIEAFRDDLETLVNQRKLDNFDTRKLKSPTAREMTKRIKELCTHDLDRSYTVIGLDHEDVKTAIFQLVWTCEMAAIVFLAAEESAFGTRKSESVGFSTEDPAMVEALYEIAQTLIRTGTRPTRPRFAEKAIRLAT